MKRLYCLLLVVMKKEWTARTFAVSLSGLTENWH